MNWGNLIKRIQALVLAGCMCFTLVPANVRAEELDSENQLNIENAAELNGQTEDLCLYYGENSLEGESTAFSYGTFDAEEISIKNLGTLGEYETAEIIYINAKDYTGNSGEDNWVTTAPSEVGKYYVGYYITFSNGQDISEYSNKYGFIIAKAKLAKSQDLTFENGTVASWTPTYSTTDDVEFGSNIISGYKVDLYVQNTDEDTPELIEEKTLEESENSVDFLSTIKGRKTAGRYYFTVTALAKETEHYENSDSVSSADSESADNRYAYSVLVQTQKPRGVTSITPETDKTNFLIPGTSSDNSLELTVTVNASSTFSQWTLYSDEADETTVTDGYTIAEETTENEAEENANMKYIFSLNSNYNSALKLYIKPSLKDITAPVINDYRAGTLDTSDDYTYGHLYGTATDADSGLVAYAFSTKTLSSDLTDSDWTSVDTTTQEYSFSKMLTTDMSGGYYYLYVKDADGNIQKSSTYIPVTKANFINYYVDGALVDPCSQMVVGTEKVTMQDSGRRIGYSFLGWDLTNDNSDFLENQVTEFCATSSPTITIYAKWTKETTSFTTQPEDIEKVYDGQEVTLEATISNDSAGQIEWQWYRKKDGESDEAVGDKITDTKTASIAIKNVADSGVYYAVVTLKIPGEEDITGTTDTATVKITKAVLTVTPSDQIIEFGQEPVTDMTNEDYYSISGLKGGDTIEVLGDVTLKFESSTETKFNYSAASETTGKAGVYNIKVSTTAPDNYSLSVVDGKTLTVKAKNVNADESRVAIKLTDDDGNAITAMTYSSTATNDNKPNINAFDEAIVDGGRNISASDYDVEVAGNTGAGDATVTVTFKNNYSGSLTAQYQLLKAALSVEDVTLTMLDFKYGEVAYPAITGNPGDNNATVTYYYYKASSSESTATTTKPESVGDYKIYARIAGGDRYEDVKTNSVAFSIKKRKIVITSPSHEWEYDGSAHSDKVCKITGDGFVSGEGFVSDEVLAGGTITNVGSVDNVISASAYSFKEGTSSTNYEIELVTGKLTVTLARLSVPTGLAWKTQTNGYSKNPAIASWNEVTSEGTDISYMVQLYKDDQQLGDPVTVTDTTQYDFAEIIRQDSITNDKTASYSFAVKTVTTASLTGNGNSEGNFLASSYSSPSSGISTISVYIGNDAGIQSVNVGENSVYQASEISLATTDSGYDGYYYMIAGETAKIVAKTYSEASFANVETIWETDPDFVAYFYVEASPAVSLSDSDKTATGYLHISDSATSGTTYRIFTHSDDERPSIIDFYATLSADLQTITFHIEAADSQAVTGWALIKDKNLTEVKENNTESDFKINAWNSCPYEADGLTRMTKHVEIDFSVQNDGSAAGDYKVYVTDYDSQTDPTGGFGCSDTITVYEIKFDDGASGTATGTMNSILKIKDQSIKLSKNLYARSGYNFKNWKSESGTTYIDEAAYSANENDTLKAQWSSKQYVYKVNYYVMNQESGSYPASPASTKSYTATYGATVAYNNKTLYTQREGYELDAGKAQTITVNDNNQVLNIYYKCTEHTFTFTYTDPAEGTLKAYKTLTYRTGQSVEKKASVGSPAIPGYEFSGWACSKVAEWPSVMPNENLVAVGSFSAKEATYYFHFYTQDLITGTDPASGITTSSTGDSFTEVYKMSAEGSVYSLNATHGTTITATASAVGTSKAPEISGFTLAGIKYTNGADDSPSTMASDAISSLKSSVTTSANAADGQEVHFYYYYLRNSYSISLSVVKDGSGGEELYSHDFTDKVYFGTPFTTTDYDYYEQYDKANWVDGYITNEYDLKDDAIYSTGERPSAMPAGNITIEQVYVKKNLSQYSVLVYKELTTEGSYPTTPDATLTYFDNEGQKVTIDDDFKTKVEASFDESQYYEFDDEKTTDTGGTVKAIDSTEPLVIRVYYKRIKTTATIKFRYIDPSTNAYVYYGTLTKTGRWGSSFSVEALNFFREGRTTFTDGTYTSDDVTFNGGAAEDYDYITNSYVASYSLTYRLDGTKNINYSYDSVAKLTAGRTETFKKVNQTGYVTYQIASSEAAATTYYVEMKYSTQKANVEAARKEKGLIADLDGDTSTTDDQYPVRLRNLADIYESTFTTGAGDSAYSEYPGLGATVRSYTYATDASGERILNSNFTTVTYKGGTYYLEDTDGNGSGDVLCIGVSSNCFYQGGNGYFNFFSNSNYPGRDTLDNILADYQTAYSEQDEQADAFYIYTGTFNEIMSGNSKYTVNFVYHDTCKATWSANNKVYKADITYGKTIDIHYVDTLTEAPFKTDLPNGYKVVWYSDSNYTKEVSGNVCIKSDVIYYGRYEKMEIEYNQYIYYELKDNLTYNGQSINYVTKENLAGLLADDDIGPRISKKEFYYSDQATLEANNYYYETEYGSKVYYPIEQTAYYVDGTFAMVVTKTRGITYSAESIDVTSARYLKGAGKGFAFDSSNSDNKINAYCQTTGVDLTAYFERSEYLVYISHSDDDSGNSVTSQAYRYGSLVEMPFPTKAGYTLAGCIVYTSSTGADGSWKYEGYIGDDSKWHGEALPSSLQVSNSVYKTGTVGSDTAPFNFSISLENEITTITMPECHVRLETPWRVATYKKDFYHFFETENGTYDTATFEKMYMADSGAGGYSKETIKIYSYGELHDGTLYKYNGSIIGATLVITEGTKNYFGNVTEESGGYYSVEESDMIVIVSTKTVTEEQVIPIRSNYCALYDFIEQGNSANYEFERLVVAKNNVAQETYDDYDNDSFTIKSIYQYAYYYARKSGVKINVVIKMNPDYDTGETVAVPSGASVLGTGDYKFGNTATLKINLPSGYTLVNWFKAEDVLEGYDSANSSNIELLSLVDPLPASGLTNVGESTDYSFSVSKSADFVALVKAEPVDTATLTVTGAKNTFSGDYVVGADNILTATASFAGDSNTQVTGYQWYEKTGGVTTKLDGATDQTYEFPKKTELGTYTYYCKATLKRSDNGKTGSVTSNEYAITVTPADLSYTVDSYMGVYDGKAHGITVNIAAEDKSEFSVYYSTERTLDEDNYLIYGSTTNPTFTNVAVDASGNVAGQNVYYYIHNSSYTDASGSATVTITPKELTVTRGKNFSKVYDGTTSIDGDVADATSLKGKFVRNGSLEFTGYISGDSNANVYADFTANFNSKDVDSASYILVSNIKMGSFDESGNFVVNNNYAVNSNAKYVTVYGSITALPLTVQWSESSRSFSYDAKAHKPVASFDTASKSSLSEIGEGRLGLSVIGEQTNAGEGYSAYAKVEETTDFNSDNYSLSNASTTFDISKLNVTVTAKNRTVTYDGSYYGLLYDDVTVTELVSGQQYIFSLADRQQKNAGTYTMTPSNLIVYTDSNKTAFATENYNITYVSASLTINPRTVGISGITISDKSYDGTVSASISNEKRTVDGNECYVVSVVDASGNNAIATGDTVLLDVSKVSAAFVTATAGEGKNVAISYEQNPLYSDAAQNYVVSDSLCQKTATGTISKALMHLYVTDTEVVYGEDVAIHTSIETDELAEADFNRIVAGEDAATILGKSGGVTVHLRKSDDQGNVEEGTAYESFVPGETEAGYYEISIASYTAAASNYYFVPATGDDSTAILTVKKRPLQVTGIDVATGGTISKVYDSSDDAKNLLTGSMYKFEAVDGNATSGLLEKDKSSVDLASFTANFNSEGVDASSVTVSNMTLNSSNYEISNNSFILKGAITKRALKITAKAENITYGSSGSFSYEIDETECLTDTDAANYKDLTAKGLKYETDYDTTNADKRNVGTYSLNCTGLDQVLTNYAITYVGTTFNVTKATITVTAKSYPSSGKLYYGGEIPTFEGSYKGSKYSADDSEIASAVNTYVSYVANDSSGNEIVQGQKASADAGTYTITVTFADGIENALSNYSWEAVNGSLTITKQTITITGVKFHPRRFNNSYYIINTSLNEFIDLSEAELTIVDEATGTDKTYKGNEIWEEVVENTDTSGYKSKGPRDNNIATIKFTLKEKWANKFEISNVVIDPAKLLKAKLYVYCKSNQKVTYGGTYGNPTVLAKVDFTGGVHSSYVSTSYTPAHMKMVNVQTGETYYSWEGDFPPVGTYKLYLQDFNVNSSYSAYYEPEYDYGDRTMTVSAGQFASPVATWSDEKAATICWKKVDDVGQVSVDHYHLKLYSVSSKNKESGVFECDVSADGSSSYEYSFESVIRANGAGKYRAIVMAYPSDADSVNVTASNKSYAKKSDGDTNIYAAKVNISYATDEVTTEGKSSDSGAITINGATGDYLIVDMEEDIPVQIKTKNAGYYVSSWNYLASGAEDENFVSYDSSSSASATTCKLKNTTHLSSSTIRNGVAYLSKMPATVSATFTTSTPRNDGTIDFGYDSDHTASFTVTADVDSDNITRSEYTYSYDWAYRENVTSSYVSFDEAHGNGTATVTMPTGLNAGSGYQVRCTVTAVRTDNGESTSKNFYVDNHGRSVALKILRGTLIADTTISKTSWVYGESRGIPGISNNPDRNTNITYLYAESASAESWSETMLTDVGTHYVKASVAESTNYDAAVLAPISYTITAATLPQVSSNSMVWAESDTAIYGMAKFAAIGDSLIPVENANTDGVSASAVSISYEISLSRQAKTGDAFELVKTVTCQPEDITKDGLCTYDFYDSITATGNYKYTVKVVVADSYTREKGNCIEQAAQEQNASNLLKVYAETYVNDGASKSTTMTAGYGDNISLSVESTANLVDVESMNKQWYLTNDSVKKEAVSGAKADTLQVKYVSQSGYYTCKLTSGDDVYYSLLCSFTINKRNITITSKDATREYDGTALSETNYEIKNDDNTTWTKVSNASKTNTYSYTWANGITDTLTFDDPSALTDVADSPKTNAISNVSLDNSDNYSVTKTEGRLTLTAKDLSKTSGSLVDDEEGLRTGISISNVSWPAKFVYEAAAFTPAVKVTDSGLATGTDYDLVSGSDYTISYSDNIAASTDETKARITITGTGNYKGQISRTFTIEKRPLEVASGSWTKKYDEVALTNASAVTGGDGYSLKNGTSFATGDYPVFTFTGSQTSCGQTDNAFSLIIKNNAGSDVTKNYTVAATYGTLTVEKAEGKIEFTKNGTDVIAETALNREYVGTSLADAADADWYTDNGAAERSVTTVYEKINDGETEILAGAPKDAGSYRMTLSAPETADYTAATASIDFTISKRHVTFTAVNQSGKYHEEIVENLGTTFEGLVIEDYGDFTIDASTTATNISDAGTYPIELELMASNENYEVTLENGTYTILPDDMTLEEQVWGQANGSASITFDNDTHTALEVKPSGTMYQSESAGDKVTVYYSDSVALTAENFKTLGTTTPISYKNAGSYTVYYYAHSGAADGSGNYKDVAGLKLVTIEKAAQEVVIPAGSSFTKVYDSYPISNDLNAYAKSSSESNTNADISYEYKSADGSTIDVNGIHVGSYKVVITAAETENYASATLEKNYVITKKPVTYKLTDYTHVYDGNPPDNSSGTIQSTSLADNDARLSISGEGSLDNISVGKYPLKLKNAIIVYAVKMVTADGTEYTNAGYEAYKDNVQLKTIEYNDGSVIYYVDRTSNYDITYLESYYEITPASASISINITAADKAKYFDRVYDRTAVPQTFAKSWYNYDGDGTVTPVYYQVGEDGTLKEMSSYPMNAGKYAVKLVASGRTKLTAQDGTVSYTGTGNYYACESELMTFEISRRAITISAASGSSKYRENLAQLSSPTVTEGSVCSGDLTELSFGTKVVTDLDSMTPVTYTSSVGSYVTVPTYSANDNYLITTENGSYTITKAMMTAIVSAGYDGAYDGDEHDAFTITLPGLPASENYTIYYRSTQMASSDYRSESTTDCKIKEEGNYSYYYYIHFDNYEDIASTSPITATISESAQRMELEVSEDSLVFTYDGNSHGVPSDAVVAYTPESTGNDSADETGATITYQYYKQNADGSYSDTAISGTPTVGGKYRVVATAAGSEHYATATLRFYLTINKLPLTITTPDATKVFDGSPLTSESYEQTSGTLLTGDTIETVTFSGTITNAGTTTNSIKKFVIKNASGQDMTDSYDITFVFGTLSVTKAASLLSISTTAAEKFAKVYDGNAVNVAASTWQSYVTFTGDKKVADVVSLAYYRKNDDGGYTSLDEAPKNAGNYAIKLTADASSNYDAAESDYLDFSISKAAAPRAVVTPYSGKYDGQNHQALSISFEGISEDDKPAVYMANTSLNSSNYKTVGSTNYEISLADTYGIYYYCHFDNYEDVYNTTPESVTISLADQKIVFPEMTVTYDGKAKDLSESIYAVGEVLSEKTGTTLSITYNGSTTAPSAVGTYEVEVKAEAISGKYNEVTDKATLTIKKKKQSTMQVSDSDSDSSEASLVETVSDELEEKIDELLKEEAKDLATEENVLDYSESWISPIVIAPGREAHEDSVTDEEYFKNTIITEDNGKIRHEDGESESTLPIAVTGTVITISGAGLAYMLKFAGGKKLLLKLLALFKNFHHR